MDASLGGAGGVLAVDIPKTPIKAEKYELQDVLNSEFCCNGSNLEPEDTYGWIWRAIIPSLYVTRFWSFRYRV